ncbi:MAG: SDR family oxidoreductase [Caldilineae bacterium]|nr:SDR family oxidoreductase [Caldilineae bacterium]
MDINGKTALVLGGAGLVGRAVCHELIREGVGTLLIGGLTEAEAREAADDLGRLHPDSPSILRPIWGNVFVRDSLADIPPGALRGDPVLRNQLLTDALDDLTDEVYLASHLVQLILGQSPQAPGLRPQIVIDAINTATALAYGGLYQTIQRTLAKRKAGDSGALLEEVDEMLASFAIPWLVRHVQLTSQAMIQAGTRAYVKIGTTGTGGMGLNIPYTHGEEKPSRVLLSKSALAGAHSMLLLLFARTPGAPAVKEIKPAAAITWKRIQHGPIVHRGQAMGRYDCRPEDAVSLAPGSAFALEGAGQHSGEPLESTFIDTGENGLFSLGEYTAITALGQMEAVTPEEIAAAVRRELRGETTGTDIVAALDSTVMGPSYRAGVLRSHAITEARAMESRGGVPSIAFEILGPPRLSKLLYEAEILRLAYGSLRALADSEAADIAQRMEQRLLEADPLRQAAISVGIPILLSDGKRLLCAKRDLSQHRWEQPGWTVDAAAIERYCHADWIDLRPANAARWRARAEHMLAQQSAESATGLTGSQLDRRFQDQAFDIGEIAAWIFIHEDEGRRIH